MPGIEIKGRSKRANYRHGGRTGYSSGKKVVKARDINKSGSIEGWEKARAKGMAKGMGATFKARLVVE